MHVDSGTSRADAPRLRAYLPRAEARSVLVAPRSEWEQMGLKLGAKFLIDVEETSLGKVASDATILATVARQHSDTSGEIVVYRDDLEDVPNRVNVDKYDVWVDLRSHQSFQQMVNSATTTVNENMEQFLDDNVFLAKQEPGDDHHLPDLPTEIRSMLSKEPST